MTATIIIPAYNSEKTVETCLASAVDQELPGGQFEVVLVDDGSTDLTAELAERFPVKVLQQPNSGPASARNHGARMAKGDILVFTDADCELEKGFLQSILAPFSNPEINGVQGAYRTRQKSVTAQFCQCEIEERYNIYKKLHKISMLGTYASAYRKIVFEENGGFDMRYPIASGEDFAFSSLLAARGNRMVFCPGAVCFHQHPDTIRKYFRQKFFRGFWRNLLYRDRKGAVLRDGYTPLLLKLQVAAMMGAPAFAVAWVMLLSSDHATWGWGIAVLYLSALSLPSVSLMMHAVYVSPCLMMVVPFFVLCRTVALATGLTIGFFSAKPQMRKGALSTNRK